MTMLLIAVYLIQGAASISVGFGLRGKVGGWGLLLLSGLASLGLGILILTGWPGTAAWTLGLLTGLNFLSNGIALILLGRGLYRSQRTGTKPVQVQLSHLKIAAAGVSQLACDERERDFAAEMRRRRPGFSRHVGPGRASTPILAAAVAGWRAFNGAGVWAHPAAIPGGAGHPDRGKWQEETQEQALCGRVLLA